MKPPVQPSHPFEEIFQAQIQAIAVTLRPDSIHHYAVAARRFVTFLSQAFPEVKDLSALQRHPHMLGWFRWLGQDRPLGNRARADYLIAVRRLLRECQHQGYPVASGLILSEDIPPIPRTVPRALSLEDDRLLDQQLRRMDDLDALTFRLVRATGMRIGECIDLPLDCLRHFSENQWALHVPIGKLYTERSVPVDEEVRQLIARILSLRELQPPRVLAHSAGLLLPRRSTRRAFYGVLLDRLVKAGKLAGCSQKITPHRLRHSYASEMIRLGVSLPAVMQLLGHKDIRMTMRYLLVTQQDLHRQFQQAHRNLPQPHPVPDIPLPQQLASTGADLPGIRQGLTATRHLLEMYRRQLQDEHVRRFTQRLAKRLSAVDAEIRRFVSKQK